MSQLPADRPASGRSRLQEVLAAGLARKQADTGAGHKTNPNVQDEPERYFYIMHRAADSPTRYAKGARRIVESGGVAPGGYHVSKEELQDRRIIYEMKGLKWTDYYQENGMHESITAFLNRLYDPSKGADGRSFKGLVAWYYLTNYNRQPILSFASDDELVFRVPLSWLEKNAGACLEHVPHMTEDATNSTFLPFAFLTTLVVPLEYRITDPTPHRDEQKLAMTTKEVRDFIYNAHVTIDPNIRSTKHYADLHAAKRASKEAEEHSDSRFRFDSFSM